VHHLSSTHTCHLHSPPLHLHPHRPPSHEMSSYWMLASTSSCSQPYHHSERKEKGQLQSRWSAIGFQNLRHRWRFKSQSQVDANWFHKTSTDSIFLKKRSSHVASCLQWTPTTCIHAITQHRALLCHSEAYFLLSQFL